MEKKCVISGCITGRVRDRNKNSNGRETSLFIVPKCTDLLKLWSYEVNQTLKANDYVCDLHFHEDDIKKHDKIQLPDGKIFISERRRYSLMPGVIPTLNPTKICENRSRSNNVEALNAQCNILSTNGPIDTNNQVNDVPYVENLFDVDDNINNQIHEEIEHPAITDHEYTPRVYPNKRFNNNTPKEKCSPKKLCIINNLKSLCRLCCQKQKELLQINEDRILRNHIETFCKIDVKKDDILPTGICFFCYDAIITFHDFIHNVNETQKYYTDIANKIDTNINQIDLNPTFSYVSSFTTTEENESVSEKNISNNDICLRDKIDTKKNLSPTFSYLSSHTSIEEDKSVPERNLSNNDICLRDKTAINLNTTCNDISSHTVIEEVITVPEENIASNNDMRVNVNENNYNKNNTKVIKTNFKINSDNIIKSVTKRKRKQNLANIEIDRSDAEPTNHIISQRCLPENWLKINTNNGDLKATNLIQIRPVRSEKQIDQNQEQTIIANQIINKVVNLIPIKTKLENLSEAACSKSTTKLATEVVNLIPIKKKLENLSEPICSKSTTKLATVADRKKIKLATNIPNS